MYVNTSVVWESLSTSDRKQKFDVYSFVGYNSVIANFEYSPTKDYRTLLQDIQDQSSLKIYGKIMILPKTQKDLKNALKNVNSFSDFLIGVSSLDKDILTMGIKDSRVDVISFPNIQDLDNVTSGIISLLKTHEKFLEISFRDVLRSSKHERSRLFHDIDKFLGVVSANTQILLYGGCERSIVEIRGPREIATIFTAIFNLPLQTSKKIVQSNPERLINILQERISPNHYSHGVKIISQPNKE
ncbi:MAG: hypothetical protein EU530_06445 [Promethearchaeota archaeon]|nr:MAG: hypothetical protein EU530_06445 [Candidatus Lokiarchaeota archaeon]